MKVAILVRPKPGVLNPEGEAVYGVLRHLGFKVSETRLGRVFDLEVEASSSEEARVIVEEICRKSLTDARIILFNPLIEIYEIKVSEDETS